MALTWAAQRKLLYTSIVLLICIGGGVWFYVTHLYSPASCFDRIQNQDELGVDCGGSCALLCEAPNISSVWSRSVRVAPGVYHAVSLVRNPDTTATGPVSYTMSLFDSQNILIATREGSFTILPGEVRPLFEANVVTGERVPTRTFIDVTPGMFTKAERKTSSVRILSWNYDEVALRLTAVIENQTVTPVSDVVVTALLFNDSDVLIGASETRSGILNSRERKTISFTWQEQFNELPTRIDIIPREVE